MAHFMEAHITIRGHSRDAFDEIIPGKVDAGLVHMSHEGAGVESIMIVIPENEDIIEIIQFEFFQSETQLYCGGAYQDGHFRGLLYFDIMEVLGLLEQIGPEKEFPLFFKIQPVIISEITGNDRMIKGL
jgi:hypothetical protein